MLRCNKCNTQLIWCNDFDTEDYGYEFEGIVGVYQCGKCDIMYQLVDNFDTKEQYLIEEPSI